MITWHPGYVVGSNLAEGESANINYNVAINWTDADGTRSVKNFQNVIPADGRWPAGWTVLAVVQGVAIDALDIDGRIEFRFYGAEKPKAEVCP